MRLSFVNAAAALVMFSAILTCSAVAEEKEAAHAVVKQLLKQAIPENSGHEVRMLTVDYAPGVSSAAHTHPGCIFVYVLEGAVICQLDDEKPVRYEAGQSWYEKPGQVHRVSKNASDKEPAKLLVFFITEPDKPVLVPVAK